MSTDSGTDQSSHWLEASGITHIFRAPTMAMQPAKLGIALVAILLTFVLGTLLDVIWKVGGGVSEDSIARFIDAREFDIPYQEVEGDQGIFQVWRNHERKCVLGLLGSSVPGASVAVGTSVGTYMESHSGARPLKNFAGMIYGGWWLLQYHPLYFVLFGLGALAIWSYAGGAICRLAAVQFARDEIQTARTALRYAHEKWFGGFFLAPCIPLMIILAVAVILILFGLVLRIWVLGDVVAGLMFWLALVGGFVITVMIVGLFVGGNLFWPSIAVQGSDAFDALNVGLSYPFSKSWKWILYSVLSLVYAGICWVFVNLFTYLMLTVTRGIVAFGTSPFGWWSRGTQENPVSKLELLWPLGGPNNLYLPPDWSQLMWYEYFSAFFIGFFVLLVIALMWSFLVSFYFSSSTIIFFLLRRDADGVDLSEVYLGEEDLDERYTYQDGSNVDSAVVLEEKTRTEDVAAGDFTLPVQPTVSPSSVLESSEPIDTPQLDTQQQTFTPEPRIEPKSDEDPSTSDSSTTGSSTTDSSPSGSSTTGSSYVPDQS